MIQRIVNRFHQKMAMSNRKHAVYILPTLDGFKVLGLNLLLLAIGLVYANNYVLLFNFILFCLCLSSMFYTHFNLNKLQLEHIHFDQIFQNESSHCYLTFKTSGHGHYFLSCKLYSDAVELVANKTFNLDPNSKTIVLNTRGLKRGKGKIHSLYIETVFPFNFFRCFTFYKLNLDQWVYPERLALNLHHEIEAKDNQANEDDSFHLKEFTPGDSMKQLDWKRFAKSEEMFVREVDKSGLPTVMLSLNPTLKIEDELKSLSHAIYRCHSFNIRYGLRVGDTFMVAPDSSNAHLNFCMEKLASYEA